MVRLSSCRTFPGHRMLQAGPAGGASAARLVLACLAAVLAAGCEESRAPAKLPGCYLEAVSPPRLLGAQRGGTAYFGEVASGPSRVGVLWDLSGVPPPDHVQYHVLDRRSGEELASLSIPRPDLTATGEDDLLVEWFPVGGISCQGASSLALYEDFRDGVPIGDGYVVADWPYFPTSVLRQKTLLVGETMVIEAGERTEDCIRPPQPAVWYVVHPRDGSAAAFHSRDVAFWTRAASIWGIAETGGQGFLLLGGASVSYDRGGGLQYCCPSHSGSCLLEIGPDGTIQGTECIVDDVIGPGDMWLVGGRQTVLVGWTEGDTAEAAGRVRALRFTEGQAAEIVSDFRPDWSPLGHAWTSGTWHWTRAGDGFALLAELAGEDAGSRGIVLVDEAGTTLQQVAVDALPPYVGSTLLAGGVYYAVQSTEQCVDVMWMEVDRSDETPEGYPIEVWLQSFCCAR